MKRVYHHYTRMEEWGMWAKVTSVVERELFSRESAALMKRPEEFLASMLRVAREWPYSCEYNLTCDSINQLAWLGQAGCFLSTGSPEDCTRVGWRTLTRNEQQVANTVAGRVLLEWRRRYSTVGNVTPLFDLELYTVRGSPRGRPNA